MANKQIHELDALSSLNPSDQLLVSTATGNLTRRASLSTLPYSATRTIVDKLGDFVSVKDLGVKGDNNADDSAALQAAVLAHTRLFFPPGTYILLSKVDVPPGRVLVGAGAYATIIDARGTRALEFQTNAIPWQIDSSSAGDWNRSAIGGMAIKMATGGLLVHGHQFRAEHLLFSGGASGGWCIEMHAASSCSLEHIHGEVTAHGIRWYALDSSTEKVLEYGNSQLHDIDLKGLINGWTGFRAEHQSTASTTGFIVGLLANRVQLRAPSVTSTTGMVLNRVRRSTFMGTVLSNLATGVSTSANILGGMRDNTFLGCEVVNVTTPWADSNASIQGSVGPNTILGSPRLGPLQTRGENAADTNIKAGTADAFLAQGLWFSNINFGEPRANWRVPEADVAFSDYQIILTGPGATSGRLDGSSLDDAHPKQRFPSKGLRFFFGDPEYAQIARTIGQTVRADARLELGNGPTDPSGPLKALVSRDPFYLTAWTTEPASPYDVSVFHASTRAALPTSSDWRGPGWYLRMEDGLDGGSSAKVWVPALVRPGIERTREVTASASLGRSDLGSLVLANHASTKIQLTIPNSLLRQAEVGANFVDPTTSKATLATGVILVERIGAAAVEFVAGSGVTIVAQDGFLSIPQAGGLARINLKRTAANTITAYISYFGSSYRGQGDGNRQLTGDYTLVAGDLGDFLQFNSASPIVISIPNASTLLPTGVKVGYIDLAREGAGTVSVAVAAGATIVNKGASSSLVSQGSTARLYITDRNEFWLGTTDASAAAGYVAAAEAAADAAADSAVQTSSDVLATETALNATVVAKDAALISATNADINATNAEASATAANSYKITANASANDAIAAKTAAETAKAAAEAAAAQAAVAAGISPELESVTVTASRDIALSDLYKTLEYSGSTDITLTIKGNVIVPTAAGKRPWLKIKRLGTGKITLVGASGSSATRNFLQANTISYLDPTSPYDDVGDLQQHTISVPAGTNRGAFAIVFGKPNNAVTPRVWRLKYDGTYYSPIKAVTPNVAFTGYGAIVAMFAIPIGTAGSAGNKDFYFNVGTGDGLRSYGGVLWFYDNIHQTDPALNKDSQELTVADSNIITQAIAASATDDPILCAAAVNNGFTTPFSSWDAGTEVADFSTANSGSNHVTVGAIRKLSGATGVINSVCTFATTAVRRSSGVIIPRATAGVTAFTLTTRGSPQVTAELTEMGRAMTVFWTSATAGYVEGV